LTLCWSFLSYIYIISSEEREQKVWQEKQDRISSDKLCGLVTADKQTRDGSVQQFVGPEPFLGVSRQNIRRKMKRWMEKQHLVLWRGPFSTQRQARKLISGPDLATRARLLSFNRAQSRIVIGLLTGHNTLRRHVYKMGMCNNPTCRECSTMEETLVHILCKCEDLASLRHTYLGSFFLDPEDIWNLI
jgi:hypothetical protein